MVQPAAGQPRGAPVDPWTLCARAAAEIEIEEDLPPHLLTAISKVESGRWLASDRTVHAWPWTVTSGGKGKFFATMDKAIAAVQALRASGRRSIDVGCMQVNLLHHPDAFRDMRAALDPVRNIAYAAGLLQRLKLEAHSWPKAIAYYHSRTTSLNRPYRRKVLQVWLQEWRRAGQMVPATADATSHDKNPEPAIPAAAIQNAAASDVVVSDAVVSDAAATHAAITQVAVTQVAVTHATVMKDAILDDAVLNDAVLDDATPDDMIKPAAGQEPMDPETILASFNIEEGETAPSLGQVQLGAFRVPENARSVWNQVLHDNAELLGDFQPSLDVVDRGELGTLHLLRVSPIMNLKLARSICDELRHRSVDCMVVEPPQRFALHEFGGPFH